MRYRDNKICRDEQTNERTNAVDGQPANVTPPPTQRKTGAQALRLCRTVTDVYAL